MTALTFISSFMAADTLGQTFLLAKERVAVTLIGIWLGGLTLSVVDSSSQHWWIGLVGLLHCLLFLASACRVFYGNVGGGHEKDYIKIPLQVFLPVYSALYIAHLIF